MRHANVRSVSCLMIAALAASLLPACHSTGERAVTFEIEPSLRVGPVSGYFQIPDGGKPGSTSLKRPRLEELGISRSVQAGLNLRARAGRHDLFLDGRWLILDGNGEAAGDYRSQDEFFPDGTGLSSNSALGTWALTYGHTIPLGGEGGVEWQLVPRAGVAAVTVRYKVDGDNGSSVNRSFTHLVPTLGAELILEPEGTDWRFLFRGQTTLTYRDRNVHVTDVAVRAGRDFGESVTGWLELGYQHFYLQDSQDFPNQVNIEFGPTLGVGVDFRF